MNGQVPTLRRSNRGGLEKAGFSRGQLWQSKGDVVQCSIPWEDEHVQRNGERRALWYEVKN